MGYQLTGMYIGNQKVRPAGGGGGLPVGYQEVEYIESSGTQYIDSGIPGANGYIAEAKVLFDYLSTNADTYVLGVGNYPDYACYVTVQDGARWRTSIADLYPDVRGGSPTTNTVYVAKAAILTSSDGVTLDVNGTHIGTKSYTQSFTTGYNLYILAAGGPNRFGYASGKLYYLKIRQGSESNLIRDFVPCYRKSDSVIGLYDLVNDVFYTNDGTGTFTKGPDVN